MHAVVTKQQARPAPGPRRAPAAAPARPARPPGAAPCACGGGCPRCAAPTHDSAALERAADAFADAALHRAGAPRVQPLAAAAAVPAAARDGAAGAGRPLAAADRAFFEARLGASLGAVRLHDGAAAADAAAALRASAYALGPDIVLGAGAPSPASPAGRRLLAHELAHVAQQQAGGTRLQRQPAPEIEMPGALAIDPRRRTDRAYAARLGRTDAARLRRAGRLSPDERAALNAKLDFFAGAAKDAYAAAIRPALREVTRPEIEMPAMEMRRKPPTPPTSLLSLDSTQLCGGRPCVADEEIYGGLKRSEAEDALAEVRATIARGERVATRKALQEDMARTRGSRAFRHARERLETFDETGTLTRPYRNYDGAPAPENWVLGAAGGVMVAGVLAEALIASLSAPDIAAAVTVTAGQMTTAVMSNPYLYLGAAVAYGAVAPPGAPDLPGPWDEVGKSLRAVGVAAEDLEAFAKGEKVWGGITRGAAEVVPYFKREGGKLIAGILSAQWRGDRAGIIRALYVWRQQSALLGRLLGAKMLRLEADVVTNTETLLPSLLQAGFKPIEGSPGSYFIELPL